MSFLSIHGALDTRLQSFGADDIVFPSRPSKAQYKKDFLVARFLPGRSKIVLLGPQSPDEHRGLYQIEVRGLDVPAALSKIDQLRAHFEKGLNLSFEGLDVLLGLSEVGPNRGNLKHTNIPLSIHWLSYF